MRSDSGAKHLREQTPNANDLFPYKADQPESNISLKKRMFYISAASHFLVHRGKGQ